MASSRSYFNQGDSWLSNYEACDALGTEIMEKIASRDQQQRNSMGYSHANVQARQLIKRFSEERDKLVEKLLATQDTILEGEFERRERLLDQLWSKKLRIDTAFNARNEEITRNELLTREARGSSNIWNVEETDETRDLTFSELKQKQQSVIEEQDRGLSSLHDVVVRQKMMAQNIGDELDLHNELLDDITDHADRTKDRLIRETRHVTIVDRKSNTCVYWVLIVLLFIAIITVICVPSKSK